MATPAELPEIIERAFVAYLKSPQFEWSPSMIADGQFRIHRGQDELANDGQTIKCTVPDDLGDEEPLYSGNFPAVVRIELRTPGDVKSASEKAAGQLTGLDYHKIAAACLHGAIMVNVLADELNAAADNYVAGALPFTCFGIRNRMPFREPDGEVFVSGFVVEILGCPQTFR